MQIDPRDAGIMLDDVAGVQRRTREVLTLARFGDYLLLTALIWFVGYVASRWTGPYTQAMWLALNLAGVAGAVMLSTRAGTATELRWRPAVSFALVLGFSLLWGWLAHLGFREKDAFGPTVVALFLMTVGLWAGRALALLGAALMALTLAGYFWAGPWFQLWLAVGGGGILLAAGLLARR